AISNKLDNFLRRGAVVVSDEHFAWFSKVWRSHQNRVVDAAHHVLELAADKQPRFAITAFFANNNEWRACSLNIDAFRGAAMTLKSGGLHVFGLRRAQGFTEQRLTLLPANFSTFNI